MSELRIGVVGDLHTHWDEVDVAHFDRSDYDLVFFTGDLGGGTASSSLRIARVMSRLRKQALVMPGNNDTGDIAELAAELTHRRGIRKLAAIRSGLEPGSSDMEDLGIRLCGYTLHRHTRGPVDLTIVAARPHSMGGPELSFPEHMQASYGIDSLEASRARLFALLDEVETENVVFFSHNGPTGLGNEPHDMWGCDFRPGGGDWGDPDLAAAIDYARHIGKRVLAVVAGHMHLETKHGRERPWQVEKLGTLYINAARVPRIFAREAATHRHHVELKILSAGVEVREVFLEG